MKVSTRLVVASLAALLSAVVTYTGCAIFMAPALNLLRFEKRGDDVIMFLIPPVVAASVVFSTAMIVTHYISKPALDRCSRCDYNLTGNVSGVCPECGTPIEKA